MTKNNSWMTDDCSYSYSDSYIIIKATSEGGDKRKLEVALEKLRNEIETNWTEGQEVKRILEDFEDVTLKEPRRLTDEEKQDEVALAIWTETVKYHVAELRRLTQAKKRLYSSVWRLLSDALKDEIRRQDGYAARSAARDVAWLVQTLRDLITVFDSRMPNVLFTNNALERVLNFRQGKNMENGDYVNCLLVLVQDYEQYCGTFGIHLKMLEEIEKKVDEARDKNGDPLSDEEKLNMKNDAIQKNRERAIAMLVIRGADQRRYGSLRKKLAMDYALKYDLYPDTVDGALTALNVYERNM